MILPALLAYALAPAVAAGVATEARAGETPQAAGERSRPTALWSVTPGLTLRLEGELANARLAYAPRFFWRTPNAENELRTLILHQAELAVGARLSRSVRLELGASGSAGEVDYTAIRTVLGDTQSAVPQSRAIAVGTASSRLTIDASAVTQVGLELRGVHRRPLDDPPPPMAPLPAGPSPFTLPKQTQLGAAVDVTWKTSATDTMAVELDGGYWRFDTGLRLFALAPELVWTRRSSRLGDRVRLSAGVSISEDVQAGRAGPRGRAVDPIGGALVARQLVTQRGFALEAEAGLNVAFYVDPVLDRGAPRGSANAKLGARIGTQWTVAADLSAATNFTRRPQPGEPIESLFAFTVPVQRRLTALAAVEGGLRWVERAPHPLADSFALRVRELWAYLAFTGAVDTGTRGSAGTRSR